ncbi:hypothetical protein PG991_006708 [Apiospora marii]|uniref:Uncharacterized protein n=1 Tax=Apiospora marii TaxID=335849 RepID=A0ABR1RZW5_9PEZI
MASPPNGLPLTAMPKSPAPPPAPPPPPPSTTTQEQLAVQPAARDPAELTAHDSATASPARSGKPNTTLSTEKEGGCSTYVNRRRLGQWNVELLMVFFVFAIPFIAFGTLFPYRGQPLPQWPFRITINSLLAVYSTILKAAISLVVSSGIAQLQWSWLGSAPQRPLHDVVRYDDAGRGPWGAMRLLWAHRLRQPLTALGALIMVLNIGVDPFPQQILRTVDCSVHLDERQALLPRTNLFGDFENLVSLYNSYSKDQLDLRSAVSDGIMSSGVTQVAQCTTGNCAFPTAFTTLGICHRCHDISDRVIVDRVCVPAFPLWRTKWDNCPVNSSVVINSTRYHDGGYTRTTFAWPTVETYNQSMPKTLPPMEVFSMSSGASVYDMTAYFMAGETLYSQARVDPFTGQPIDGCEKKKNWPCSGHGAAQCTLTFCVKEYSATVEAGRTKETLLSQSTPMELPPPGFPYFPDTGNMPAILDSWCVDGNMGRDLEQRGYRFNPQDRWQAFNVSKDNETASPIYPSLFTKGCLFAIPSHGDLIMSIYDIFAAFGHVLKTPPNINGRLRPFSNQVLPETQEILHVYNYGKVDFEWVDNIMANLSESLTRFLRTHGNPTSNYSSPAKGLVWQQTVCGRIDWWWSAYPITLAISTLLFFALVVSLQDGETPVWKSSPLAWILCRAEEKTQGGPTDHASSMQRPGIDELEKDAENIKVSLRTDPTPCYQVESVEGNVRRRKACKVGTSTSPSSDAA